MRHIFGYGDHSNDLKLLKYFEPTAFKMVDEAEDISRKNAKSFPADGPYFVALSKIKLFILEYSKK